MDKLVQGKTILFVIFRLNCLNSGVIVANIKNCNFIIVIGTVSKMPLVRLVKELKTKSTSLHEVRPGFLERLMFQKGPWN